MFSVARDYKGGYTTYTTLSISPNNYMLCLSCVLQNSDSVLWLWVYVQCREYLICFLLAKLEWGGRKQKFNKKKNRKEKKEQKNKRENKIGKLDNQKKLKPGDS